ncbi:DNRLRE domain-containing protein [bacterium]|nr:DNRLRE domain-containing protein [bacterium]
MLSKLLKYLVGLILLIAATSWAVHIDDLEPTDDSFTSNWDLDRNWNGWDLQCYTGADEARLWIWFVLPDPAPIGETWIYDAHIFLYIYDRLGGHPVEVRDNVDESWTEENITWRNQPNAPLTLADINPVQGQWLDFHATYVMNEWYAYGTLPNNGLCYMFISAENGFWAYDKESYQEDYRPYMDVTYDVVTPSDFNLTSPPNGTEFDVYETASPSYVEATERHQQPVTDISGDRVSYDVTFQWQASTTDGPGNITYHLLVDNDSDFSGYHEVDVDGLSSTTYTHSFDVTEDITYYWRVTAKESKLDVETRCLNDFEFSFDWHPDNEIEEHSFGYIKAQFE